MKSKDIKDIEGKWTKSPAVPVNTLLQLREQMVELKGELAKELQDTAETAKGLAEMVLEQAEQQRKARDGGG